MKKTTNKIISLSVIPMLVFLAATSCQPKQSEPADLNANQKEATDATIAANNALLDYLSFEDKRDSINAWRGFIGTIEEGKILSDLDDDGDDDIVYSMEQFEFLERPAPSTANPSLWRQSKRRP